MKIIPKFQKGGGFTSFFTTYTPTQMQTPKQASEERSTRRSRREDDDEDNQKGKLTEKQLFDMISKIDGLPNEMIGIIRNLQNTFAMDNLIGVDPTNLATTYLSSLYQLKIAEGNKKKYDEALSAASKSGALNEPAISTNGKLIVQTQDGQLDTISLDEYFNDTESYQPLTVSNLARLRAYDPSLNNNQSIFDVLNNSIGFEEFQALVESARKGLGTNEFTRNGLFTNEGEASKGLQLLNTLKNDDKAMAVGSAGIEGLYEYKIIDKTQAQQLKALTQYITTVLPDRAKTWAALKTGNPNKNKATQDLVFTYLFSGTTQSHQFDIQYKGSIDEVTGNNKNGKKEKDVLGKIDMNTPSKFIAGYGEQRQFILNPGTTRSYQVLSTSLPLTNNEDKPIGPNSTLQAAAQGNFSGILDFTNVSMGGNLINSTGFKGIVLSDGRIHSVDYPIDIGALNKDGSIIPDTSIKTVRNIQNANRELKGMGINPDDTSSIKQNYNTINQVYQKYQLPPAYDSEGQPLQEWRRFGVINAMADNRILNMGVIDDNPLLNEVTDDSTIDNLVEIVGDTDFSKKGWFGGDSFYQGTVWIPIISDYHSALIGTKQTGAESLELDKAQQIKNAINNYKSGRQPQ